MKKFELRSAYAEKLLDPRWQKMRLQILERDEWRCQLCYDTEETLHVHHKYYTAWGTDPWDYPETALITLCAPCHEMETYERQGAETRLLTAIKQAGFTAREVVGMAAGFEQLIPQNDMLDVAHAVYDLLHNPARLQVTLDRLAGKELS